MPKPAYKSVFEEKSTYRRDVWIDGKWQGHWYFPEDEDADRFVRGLVERQDGPGTKRSVIVGDRDSNKPRMWETYKGIEKPHDL
jgi:hypothetical protein